MASPSLPWAGMPNVKCTLERDSSGTVTGRCVISMGDGVEPIVLTARANERQIAQLVLQKYKQAPTNAAVAGQIAPGAVANAARQQVLNKLAQGFRRTVQQRPPAAAMRPNSAMERAGITPRMAMWMLAQKNPAVRAHLMQAVRERLARANGGSAASGAAVSMANRARRLLNKARSGDPIARRVIAGLDQRARAGNRKAQRDRRILAAVAQEAPRAAVAGMVDVAAPAVEIGFGPPMSLHNYYTISGQRLRAEDFYSGCAASGQARTCEGVSGGDVDLIIGADGTQYQRGWDGARYVWNELRPRRGIRPEASNFSMRDALLLGMRRIQQRELAN